jgi:hypothetical protein
MLHRRVLSFKDSPVFTYCLTIASFYSLPLSIFLSKLMVMVYQLMLLGALMLGKCGARQQQCEVTTITRRPVHRVTHVIKKHNNAQATFYINTYVYNDLHILH